MRRARALDHDAAVARRLELLTAELASVRGEGPAPPAPRPRLRVAGADAPDEPEEPGERDDGLGPDTWRPGAATRLRPGRWESDPRSGPEPVVPLLPGRHASRRRFSVPWHHAVPEPLRGRWALEPGQVAVLAVAVALGLALTCWWLVRSGGRDVAVPSVLPVPDSALATPAGGSGAAGGGSAVPGATVASARGARIVVDMTGRVRHPGIVVLRAGARVVDALRAAGGARPGTRLGSLNLARVLSDGEQIMVGATASPGSVPAPGASPSGSPVVGLVDLNTADETALESLPEVGPVTAQAIIAWRTEHGGFTAVSQLLDVDGIGDATLAKLTPYVTI